MTTLAAVRAKIIADATVAGLVGERVYPQLLPQGVILPAVVLTVVSEMPVNSLTGTPETRLLNARLQVDSYAPLYLDAHAVATAVDNVVAGLMAHDLSAYREQLQDLYDNEMELHRVSVDYFVSRSQ